MYKFPVYLRWADMDPNFHLRHSVYYDFGASCRVAYLEEHGLGLAVMEKLNLGPIIFREEALFRREVRMGDSLYITLEVTRLRRDMSRFSFRHQLFKEDGTLCAVMNIDGAWLDTSIRKLAVPPPEVAALFESSPKAADFSWEEV
ncbi:MAG: acyl-CoA thioesterase [Bacteroidetes bacterium]|nr:acyl-CoA thioesterase [Bacteroidota bacterium]